MTFDVIHIDEVVSTNSYLLQRDTASLCSDDKASTLPTNPIVLVAEHQTGGRGCGTNSWESERGKNLLFSVRLHPENVPASCQFILSMANALALFETLEALTSTLSPQPSALSIKWPNDIYWNGRKIAGTLIETTLSGSSIKTCVIGTGLNVNQTVFHSDAPNPVSLRQILGHDVDRQEVLRKLLDSLSKYLHLVNVGGLEMSQGVGNNGSGAWEAIRTAYRSRLYRLHETALYRFTDGTEAYCKLLNVTDDGHLQLLRDNGNLLSLAFKEVQFVLL
jgi:BirA family biotin operon repressor/biotin-[acetyl-CoA-carboxylase] ligase